MNIFESIERIFNTYCQSKDMANFLNLQDKLEPLTIKHDFHFIVTGRGVSLTVFCSHWSIWVFGNHCQSLAVFQCC